MRVADFDFDLPEDLIALFPVSPRDAARVLHVAADGLSHRRMSDLPVLLRPGDLMVVNDTRVIRAQHGATRLARVAGGPSVHVDLTLHKRTGPASWRAFARPAKRLAAGDALIFGDGLEGRVACRAAAEVEIEFSVADRVLDRALEACGEPPLPPYIARRRASTIDDANNYQTVYAREPGSVAAPTAGLHFTPQLLERLEAAGVSREAVTLHVGAGTFLPVVAEDTDEHRMHPEWGEITEDQAARINAAIAAGARIIAVGTTTLRLLESAADSSGRVRAFAGETDIFITPGYRFRVVDALITNFHLPRSTLFMLVCAFAGTNTMRDAYRAAIAQRYRFYSYGDACLLERVP